MGGADGPGRGAIFGASVPLAVAPALPLPSTFALCPARLFFGGRPRGWGRPAGAALSAGRSPNGGTEKISGWGTAFLGGVTGVCGGPPLAGGRHSCREVWDRGEARAGGGVFSVPAQDPGEGCKLSARTCRPAGCRLCLSPLLCPRGTSPGPNGGGSGGRAKRETGGDLRLSLVSLRPIRPHRAGKRGRERIC